MAVLGEIEVIDGVGGQEQETMESQKGANAPKRHALFTVVIVTMAVVPVKRARQISFYGETVIAAGRLVTLPIDAVTCTVPPVVMPATISTSPADTVARPVLLEVQVATSVTSCDPLQVTAVAVSCTSGSLVVTVPL